MTSIKNLTIFTFEAAWTDTFKEEDGFLPQSSILPYVRALSENAGCDIIYRQIRTVDDFENWTEAIKNTKAGKRIVWIAGHGQEKGKEGKKGYEVQIRMPDYKRPSKGNRLLPSNILNCLSKSGSIDGIIIDSCDFGKNEPANWIPNNVMWALAYRASVEWTESVFFGIKTIEWLYERSQHPTNGLQARTIFERGIKTGGYKKKENQFSLIDFGKTLKAIFFYKTKGSQYWQTLKSEELSNDVET
jgi:hypothetical protein